MVVFVSGTVAELCCGGSLNTCAGSTSTGAAGAAYEAVEFVGAAYVAEYDRLLVSRSTWGEACSGNTWVEYCSTRGEYCSGPTWGEYWGDVCSGPTCATA